MRRLVNEELQTALQNARRNLTSLEMLAMDCECSITEENLTREISAIAIDTSQIAASYGA